MAVISTLLASLGFAAAATAVNAAGTAFVGLMANIGFGMIGAIGGSSAIAAAPAALGVGLGALTIAGGVAALGTAGMGIASAYSSARQSAKQQQAQIEAIKKMQAEQSGILEVNKTQQTLQDNSRKARTLSSLRIGMLPQAQDKEEVTRNAYGVDTNQVATATQNMMGLNIAVA